MQTSKPKTQTHTHRRQTRETGETGERKCETGDDRVNFGNELEDQIKRTPIIILTCSESEQLQKIKTRFREPVSPPNLLFETLISLLWKRAGEDNTCPLERIAS